MLLARGAAPASIAAITFTELAASALGARVHRYVDELLAGRVPKPLQPALPDGLSKAQFAALSVAAGKLDELTATTIHAFCQTVICSYAVEADIDPGARILDAAQAEAAFDAVLEQWFRRRLNGPSKQTTPSPPYRSMIRITSLRPCKRSRAFGWRIAAHARRLPT